MPDRITQREIYDELKKLSAIITGDGDPEKGMVVKQVLMQKDIDLLKDDIAAFDKKLSLHTGFNGKPVKSVLGLSPETRAILWKYFIRAGIIFLFGGQAFKFIK